MSSWQPISTAPRDGTWFIARCTEVGYEQERLVHFADKFDRLPIDHSEVIWMSVPNEWRPL